MLTKWYDDRIIFPKQIQHVKDQLISYSFFSGWWGVDAKLSLTMINSSHMKTNTSTSLGLGNKKESFYGDDTHCLLWRAMFIQRMTSWICYAWLMILRHPASNLSSIPTKVGLYHKHVDINIWSKKSRNISWNEFPQFCKFAGGVSSWQIWSAICIGN